MVQLAKFDTVPSALLPFEVDLHLFAHLVENAVAKRLKLAIEGSGSKMEDPRIYIIYLLIGCIEQ